MAELSEAELDELVEQAVVDAYGHEEQMTGIYTMIDDNLALPFTTTVLGIEANVEGVDLGQRDRRDMHPRRAPSGDPDPPPPAPGAPARLGVDRRVSALGGRALSEYHDYEFLALERPL